MTGMQQAVLGEDDLRQVNVQVGYPFVRQYLSLIAYVFEREAAETL